MPWPLSQDYNEAIQNPTTNFADPYLKRGEAATNKLGLPMPYSGNFADVYQMRCPDGPRWAVKCFTREAPGLRERYQEIGRHLRRVQLPFTVDFTYLEQGIRVAGRWYPVLKMEWVEGFTLNQFVGKYAGDPAMLAALLQRWGRVAKYLRQAQVGHCDLQHGNVLLTQGASANSLALKLIDYDGMWVPALAGKKSGEVGHASYQHPQRLREQSYNIDVDRFPALLIATALRTLAVKGRPLWEKYDNGDNMLFREADLLEPLKSPLFFELTKSGDDIVSRLTDVLVKALRGRMETVPLLEEVMPEAPPVAVKPRTRVAVTAAPSVPAREVPKAEHVTAAASTENPWSFGEPDAEASAVPSAKRPWRKSGKIGGVPVWAWAAAITLLLFAVGVAGGLAIWAFSGNGNSSQADTNGGSAQASTPPKDKQSPPKDGVPRVPRAPDPAPRETSVKDFATVDREVAEARSTYFSSLREANAALLLRYDSLLKSFEAAGDPETSKLRDEMQSFQTENALQGREELRNGITEYWRSVKADQKTLAFVYTTAISDCQKLNRQTVAGWLQRSLANLAPEAPLASLECLSRPGNFVGHRERLGFLTPATTPMDRLNATFEIVPGLADINCVSFRSVNFNYPHYWLAHSDFRIQLRPAEDANEEERLNGTFKQVKGLAPGGVSFESANYPGYYIHARNDALFLDKYEDSADFQREATFAIVEARFKLDDSAAGSPAP